uniref:Lipoprotein n=1 Tax=Fundidesulfovibrio putealis TaxID=270496 RepID=A0A7C4EJ26_9BACT
MRKVYLFVCLALVALGLPLAGECAAKDPTGRYVFSEPGYKGTMTISRMGPGYVFTFKTTSLSNGQMCDFKSFETPMDEGGGRVDDDLPAKGGTKDDGIKFTISFKGDTAIVDAESKGDECGMSGNFSGSYRKAK